MTHGTVGDGRPRSTSVRTFASAALNAAVDAAWDAAHAARAKGPSVWRWRLSDGAEVLRLDQRLLVAEANGQVVECALVAGDERPVSAITAELRGSKRVAS